MIKKIGWACAILDDYTSEKITEKDWMVIEIGNSVRILRKFEESEDILHPVLHNGEKFISLESELTRCDFVNFKNNLVIDFRLDNLYGEEKRVFSSKFKGVSRSGERWTSRYVDIKGKMVHIGTWTEEDQAAISHDFARVNHARNVLRDIENKCGDFAYCAMSDLSVYGEKSNLNFPDSEHTPSVIVDKVLRNIKKREEFKLKRKYKGVVEDKDLSSFKSQFKINGETVYLGTYSEEEVAATAYDYAIIYYKKTKHRTGLNISSSSDDHIKNLTVIAKVDKIMSKKGIKKLSDEEIKKRDEK